MIPPPTGSSAPRRPTLFEDGWRVFYTRQHGDNMTFEVLGLEDEQHGHGHHGHGH